MEDIKFPVEVSGIKTRPLYRNHNKPDGLFGTIFKTCGMSKCLNLCRKSQKKIAQKHDNKLYS